MKRLRIIYILLCSCFITNSALVAQTKTDSLSGIKLIDHYLSIDKPKKAASVLKAQIQNLKENNQADSLYKYPYYVGKVTQQLSGKEHAIRESEAFVVAVLKETNNARTHYKAYLNLDDFFYEIREDNRTIGTSKKALEYALTLPDITQDELGKIYYHIGGNYYALYDAVQALTYFKKAAIAYEKAPAVEKDKVADAYNGVATSMWELNKLDSAKIYYEKAISATRESQLKQFERTYYVVAFQFNLALVIEAQGNLQESIAINKNVINTLQNIIKNSSDSTLVEKSKGLEVLAISNLAATYHDSGYLTQANKLLKFVIEKKTEIYGADHPRTIHSILQVSNSEFQLQEIEKSIQTAQKAEALLKQNNSDYAAIEAEAYYAQARGFAALDSIKEAKKYFEKSKSVFENVFKNTYSRQFVSMLREYSFFLSKNQEPEKALSIAKQAYKYISENGGEDNVPLLNDILNLSRIYYETQQYQKAHQWALKGNDYLQQHLQRASSLVDSIQIQFKSPEITLLATKSLYQLTTNKTQAFLEDEIEKLEHAVTLLERRKTAVITNDDSNNLLSEYKQLTNFIKKLQYELFTKTKEEKYVKATLATHESSIYNRLRTHLNMQKDMAFTNLPASVTKREKQLKNNMSRSLKTNNPSAINSFFEANKQWKIFQDSLKQQYPKYYKMRYATLNQSLDEIEHNIPKNTTVVRYFFIEDNLYVFITNGVNFYNYKLPAEKIEEQIAQLQQQGFEVSKISPILTELYAALWQPFENKITTEQVVIIPDGPLFNLSFEVLTPKPITSFKALATQSLLATYNLSYNYSLLLLNADEKPTYFKDNYVAFAPEFNSSMKKEYQVALTDSSLLDRTYLTLLPQPFSKRLIEKFKQKFNGNVFLNQKASKQIFKNEAREHKIIHIGTHAESNNIHPELSRLVFAKNTSEVENLEDNLLYSYEIYNYNLASNLAILTACETGKPTYQPGEGMISLAHAFNYSGSESILTSLWKIDEQSSAAIIDYFYENLKKGWPKDKALREAKLSYLAHANGRTLSPQYWSGLVLIGNTTALELSTKTTWWYWALASGVLIIVLSFIYFRRKKKS